MTSDETRVREAMECLRAEDDLAEKVLERAATPGRRARRGGPLPLAFVVAVCAAVLLATGGVAYAVATSGFFQRAFGDHGMGERSEWGFTTWSGDAYEFTREFSDVVPEGVAEELEAAVEEVGLVTQGNGYTLTVEDMVVDENGCGAVTFTLENPDGLGLDAKNGVGMWDQTGMLWLTGSEGLDLLSMGFADGEPSFPNVYCVYERDSLTKTSVRATMYFDSFTGLDGVLSGTRWELKWHVGEGGDASKRHEAATDWFTPTKVVDAREFSCDGMSASLAPMSIVYELSDELADQCYMLSTSHVSIRMKDGTELVIRDEGAGVVNTYTDTGRDHYTISHTLTQIVDVAQVESIAMVAELDDGRGGEEIREFTLTPTA